MSVLETTDLTHYENLIASYCESSPSKPKVNLTTYWVVIQNSYDTYPICLFFGRFVTENTVLDHYQGKRMKFMFDSTS